MWFVLLRLGCSTIAVTHLLWVLRLGMGMKFPSRKASGTGVRQTIEATSPKPLVSQFEPAEFRATQLGKLANVIPGHLGHPTLSENFKMDYLN
jgi:hypothetical protein